MLSVLLGPTAAAEVHTVGDRSGHDRGIARYFHDLVSRIGPLATGQNIRKFTVAKADHML